MKKIKIIPSLFVSFILTTIAFSQEGWFQQISGTTNNLNSVFFIDGNHGWIAGNNGTILRTTNGGTDWTSQFTDTTKDLYSVHFIDQNTGWITGENGTILNTTNGGINWTAQTSGTNTYLTSVFFTDQNTGWVVGNTVVLKTTNGGSDWLVQNIGAGNYYYSVFFINEAIGWVVGAGFIIKTTDGGSTWYPQSGGSSWAFILVFFINPNIGWIVGVLPVLPPPFPTILLSTTNGGTVWNGQSNYIWGQLNAVFFTDQYTGWTVGTGEAGGRICKTTDGGVTWILQFGEGDYGFSSVFFTDSNTGWAIGGGGIILKTINGGVPVELTSFTGSVLQDGKHIHLEWITETETNNKGFSIERRSDIEDWQTIAFVEGKGTTTARHIYNYTDNFITRTSVFYRLKQIDYDGSFEYSNEIEVKPGTSPGSFFLNQNYPNPFNPSTMISYSIPEYSNVTLKVFDILGNEIETLINEEKPAGQYELKWNAEEQTGGVYFYQLRAGSYSETKKMILMR